MSTEQIDPAAVMAAHGKLHRCIGGDYVSSRSAVHMDPPCEPYRLAEALAASEAALIEMTRTAQKRERERDKFFRDLTAERARVARVEALVLPAKP